LQKPKNECRRKIVLNHFGFGVPGGKEKAHTCCDIFRNDFQCFECDILEVCALSMYFGLKIRNTNIILKPCLFLSIYF